NPFGPGVDTVNVLATTGSLEIAGNGGGGNDSVTFGKLDSMAGIQGSVFVHNTPSRTHPILDHSQDQNNVTVTLAAGSITGPWAPITYATSDVNSVDVTTGSGVDEVDVLGSGSSTPTTLTVGAGANFINVKGTGLLSPLKINDGPFDAVRL